MKNNKTEFELAWAEFISALVKSLKLDVFVVWLSNKIDKIIK